MCPLVTTVLLNSFLWPFFGGAPAGRETPYHAMRRPLRPKCSAPQIKWWTRRLTLRSHSDSLIPLMQLLVPSLWAVSGRSTFQALPYLPGSKTAFLTTGSYGFLQHPPQQRSSRHTLLPGKVYLFKSQSGSHWRPGGESLSFHTWSPLQQGLLSLLIFIMFYFLCIDLLNFPHCKKKLSKFLVSTKPLGHVDM